MPSSLIDSLKTIEDFREFNGKEYPLWAILFFAILAIASAAKTYIDVQRFIEKHFLPLKAFFGLKCRRFPTQSCIWKILTGVNVEDLERVFREYFSKLTTEFGQEQVELVLTHVATNLATPEEKQAVEQLTAPISNRHKHLCMDGKTLRGSKSYTRNEKAVRLFNVFEKIHNLVVAHVALTSDKDSEIPAFETLLQELDLRDVIVTVDALQCKKKLSN
jgi:hypothetical protein